MITMFFLFAHVAEPIQLTPNEHITIGAKNLQYIVHYVIPSAWSRGGDA